jgi:hypothetical protein
VYVMSKCTHLLCALESWLCWGVKLEFVWGACIGVLCCARARFARAVVGELELICELEGAQGISSVMEIYRHEP